MRTSARSIVAKATIVALALMVLPAPSLASGPTARLEGLLLDVDGRPASGYRVHLIDDNGGELANSGTDRDGVYSFRNLPSGKFSLAVENSQGQVAPVAAPPVRLDKGALARRDLKLMQADAATRNQALQANYSMGTWWAGLSTAAKAWTIIAIVAVVGVTASALDDDDPAARCGDNVVQAGEQCDDGNTSNGDGCSSTCMTESVSPSAP